MTITHRFRMWVAALFIGEIREQRDITARAYRDLARERAAAADLLGQLHDAHKRIRNLELDLAKRNHPSAGSPHVPSNLTLSWLMAMDAIKNLPETDA